jgi:hypothetical protein
MNAIAWIHFNTSIKRLEKLLILPAAGTPSLGSLQSTGALARGRWILRQPHQTTILTGMREHEGG